MKEKLIKITCTEEQAWLIEAALDSLSRVACGQVHHIVSGIEHMVGNYKEVECDSSVKVKVLNGLSEFCEDITYDGKISGYRLGSHIENLIKPILFPELHPNASYGVGQKEIGKSQIAYEMVKKLQNFRVRNSKGDCGVLSHEPLHYSDQPLIQIEEVKSEKQNKKK